VTLVCPECGDGFDVQPARAERRKYCSKECQSSRVTLTCDYCEDQYEVVKAREEESRFCSAECLGKSGTGRTAKWHDIECEWCGDVFEVVDSEKHRRFCSYECKGNWQSTIKGRDHWSWRGGRGVIESVKSELTPAFSQVRDEAREDECENCGKTAGDVGRELDVHHIIPVRSGGTNGEWNLMTLCPSCHHRTENYCRQYPGFEPLLKHKPD
jgi:5-methylcytosine-specific restriction endonuclease McrA